MPVTIRDIAQRAGVSVSTASRALNKKDDVSKETRERVLAAARELNYAVNLHARALAGATGKTVGFVLYDSSTAFHAAMARGVEDVATAHGYSLIVCNTGGAPDAELRAHQMLREKRVDGVLINSVQSGSEPLRRLAAEGIPYVLLNRRMDDLDADYVIVDYRRGTHMATTYLLELGHRRILLQTAEPEHPPVRERVVGYRQALEQYGVAFDPDLLLQCSHGLMSTHSRVLEVMTSLHPAPTAILAYNDLWAIPVLSVLHELGLRVPDDVAVVGHNDLEFARFLIPPLTTIAHPVYEMGRRAAEILFRKISQSEDEPWRPQRIILEPRLITRQSSGAAVAVAGLGPAGAKQHIT